MIATKEYAFIRVVEMQPSSRTKSEGVSETNERMPRSEAPSTVCYDG